MPLDMNALSLPKKEIRLKLLGIKLYLENNHCQGNCPNKDINTFKVSTKPDCYN